MNKVIALLKPIEYVDTILKIDFENIKEKGYENYILDIDNTVAKKKSDIDPEICKRILEAKEKGYIKNICLVSNLVIKNDKRKERAEHIARQLGGIKLICAYGLKSKPFNASFIEAMKAMKAETENTVVIGDQIFTDILGANRLGLYSILVKPLGKDNFFNFNQKIS